MSGASEFYLLRHGLRRQREQLLASSVRSELVAQVGTGALPTKLMISSSEINGRHGTGVLLGRIFGGDGVLSLMSRRDHGVDGEFPQLQLPDPYFHRERARVVLATVLRDMPVDEALLVPHFADEVRSALLLREMCGIPIVTWMMDDPTLGESRIAREELAQLFKISEVCFAISPVMAAAYAEEFGVPFHVLPPTVSRAEVAAFAAADVPPNGRLRSAAVMMGNVWNQQWLEALGPVLSGTGWEVDWFGPSADARREQLPPGIAAKGFLKDEDLHGTLGGYPFAILPTGPEGGSDAMRALTLWSLPSRLVFLFAACQIPVLVVGAADSCAATVVRGLGVGTHCGYQIGEFREAAARLLDPIHNTRCRERCRAVAPMFISDGLANWIWESGKAGKPADERFGGLEGLSGNLAEKA